MGVTWRNHQVGSGVCASLGVPMPVSGCPCQSWGAHASLRVPTATPARWQCRPFCYLCQTPMQPGEGPDGREGCSEEEAQPWTTGDLTWRLPWPPRALILFIVAKPFSGISVSGALQPPACPRLSEGVARSPQARCCFRGGLSPAPGLSVGDHGTPAGVDQPQTSPGSTVSEL